MPPPPIRFVLAVVGLWAAARVAVLAPWAGPPVLAPRQTPQFADATASHPLLLRRQEPSPTELSAPGLLPAQKHGAFELAGRAPPTSSPRRRPVSSPAVGLDTGLRRYDEKQAVTIARRSADPAIPAIPAPPVRRWSGDAYLFVRGDGGGSLAPGGQLGGGQAFARLNYRLAEGVAATVRVSRALRSKDGEVALGLAWQPVRGVRLLAERRIAVERGGRDAWAALAAGGIDAARIGPLRVDGYAQAGMVGARSRDLFADGALRAGREIGRLTLGAGLWGAAQPGVARLDVGPQAALRLPQGITVALDGRLRVAGDARPGSGLALTVATGF